MAELADARDLKSRETHLSYRFKPGFRHQTVFPQTNQYRGVEQLVARRAHNPEVVGSSPSPATKTKTAPNRVLFLFSLFIRLKFLTGSRHGQKRLNHCKTAFYGCDYLYLSRTALYSGFFRSSARLPFVAPVRQSMLYLRMFRRVSSE